MKRLLLLALFSPLILTSCSFSAYTYFDLGFKPLENKQVTLEGIDTLTLDWVNGTITFEQFSEDVEGKIDISENEEKYPLYYKVDKSELIIKYVKNNTSNSVMNNLSKSLNLKVPQKMKKIDVSSINTKIDAPKYLYADNLEFKMTNGSFTAGGIKAKKTDFDMVNASINVQNVICEVSVDQESKEETITPCDISIDTVNGSATLGIDEAYGYQVSFHAVNGKYATYYQEETKFEYLGKNVRVEFDSVNGNLNIVKNKVVE